MKTIEEKVKKMIKWKKSISYMAEKLGVSEQEVQEAMKTIRLQRFKKFGEAGAKAGVKLRQGITESKVNLEKNTTELKAISFTEPKSADEIVELLKLDTTKWKLSSYWNKQQSDHWLVSALVTQKTLTKDNLLAECLSNFKPDYVPLKKDEILVNKEASAACAVLSLQDLHFGKEGNEDVKIRLKSSLHKLLSSLHFSYKLDKIVYVLGGDLINVDTFNNTTTSGTHVDSSKNAIESYMEAFNAMYWSINFLKQFCTELHVVYIPGNHDRLSSFHLAHALENAIRDEKIIWDCEYAERKVLRYGVNMFGIEHGDVKVNPLIYATEFPIDWGNSSNRVIFTGHYHYKKTTTYITENEIHGVSIKVLPSLSNTDYWHYHNKYTGAKRSAVMEIYCPNDGKVAEYNVTF